MNQDYNQDINVIFSELANIVYVSLGAGDNVDIDVLLQFDDLQRVTGLQNMTVGNDLKSPTAEDFASLNDKASEILKLPEIYKLKTLHIEIKDGNFISIPTYVH